MSEHDIFGYLSGELDAGERRRFETAMAGDSRLRERVDELRPVLARLDSAPREAWKPPVPPALAHRPDAPAAPASRRLVLRPAVAALCAVALVAAGVGLGVLAGGGSDDARSPVQPPAQVLTLDPVDGSEPSAGGRVVVRDDGGEHATLRVSGLAPVPGHFYELWLLGADGQLVALGSFPVDASGTARIDVPLPVDAADFRFFDVSLEAEDGDPGHSGMSVLRGATSA